MRAWVREVPDSALEESPALKRLKTSLLNVEETLSAPSRMVGSARLGTLKRTCVTHWRRLCCNRRRCGVKRVSPSTAQQRKLRRKRCLGRRRLRRPILWGRGSSSPDPTAPWDGAAHGGFLAAGADARPCRIASKSWPPDPPVCLVVAVVGDHPLNPCPVEHGWEALEASVTNHAAVPARPPR